MNRCIFHIPWKPDEKQNVAPDIRVIKISNALKEIGYQVEIIWGRGKERKQRIKKIKHQIKVGIKFDFLYSESSTYPTLLTEPHHLPSYPFLDFSFFKFCKKNKIPIGLFLRDVYWSFKEVKRFNIIKQIYSTNFHIYDILIYNKFVDLIFFPHIKMRKHVSFLRSNINFTGLLPGANDIKCDMIYNAKILYVGCINPQLYDITEMLKAFKITDAELILCCREREWVKFKTQYEDLLYSNISVIHLNTKEIEEIYKKVSYAIIYLKPQEYRKITIPFKLFEYIGYEKPIITSNNTTVAEFVEQYDIGFVVNYNSNNLRQFLTNLPSKKIYEEKVQNLRKFKRNNLWIERAKQIARDLVRE